MRFSRNSIESPACFCISSNSFTQRRARWCAALPSPLSADWPDPFLYIQWAAMPDSATACMSAERTWISIGAPYGPNSTVCSDW